MCDTVQDYTGSLGEPEATKFSDRSSQNLNAFEVKRSRTAVAVVLITDVGFGLHLHALGLSQDGSIALASCSQSEYVPVSGHCQSK